MSRLWVIDTNVIVSGLLYPASMPGLVLEAGVGGGYRFAYNAPTLAEYREVLSRRKFGFSPAAVDEFVAALLRFPPTATLAAMRSLPDPDDEPFLAVALATPDRVLVTGNIRDYPAAVSEGITLLTPRAAYTLLMGPRR